MARGAKRKQLLAKYPRCIYCGDKATTVDHMPNKGMFPNDRPDGLIFPCCEACNQASKWFEDIVAFVGSVSFVDTQESQNHFLQKLKHLMKMQPELADELLPTRSMTRETGKIRYKDTDEGCGALNLSGPRVQQALFAYGAKLALALHWQKTNNMLRRGQVVEVLCFTNAHQIEGSIPHHLLQYLPEFQTLRQGRLMSAHPFGFTSQKVIDADIVVHAAFFGDAIMYQLISGDRRKNEGEEIGKIFERDFIRTISPVEVRNRTVASLGPYTI